MSAPALRPPEQVMRLSRMGAAFATRLSFMRQLLRRMHHEAWRFERRRFDVDAEGFGTVVLTAHGPVRPYSLVAFTRGIDPEQRTDRVIAEVWDATFVLFDGVPGDGDIARLAANAPLQEAGRFTSADLVLARANKSLRLWDHVVTALAEGRQPDPAMLADVGYLMRSTAVYGSGKFGCADRARIADRVELAAPFQAEMLAVYMIRWLTIELVNHIARERGGAGAVALDTDLARGLGIGNSTGLGMAPFVVKHPQLIHRWVLARETALLRIREKPAASEAERARFDALLSRARTHVAQWSVEDAVQTARIVGLRADLADLADWVGQGLPGRAPWDAVYRHAQMYDIEAQELTVALLIELLDDAADDLAAKMSAPSMPPIDPAMPLSDLKVLVHTHFDWALRLDHGDPRSQRRFWYYSEDKLEPRLGDRFAEPGADREMPLAVARDVAALSRALEQAAGTSRVADFLLRQPEHRHTVRRVQAVAAHPYGEIRDSLLAEDMRPLDVLRFKLAFFGVSKFDPKSDLWTRVTMYQGAPLPMDLSDPARLDWAFALNPAPQGVQVRNAQVRA